MRFEKVSYDQYISSIDGDIDLLNEYNDIKLPQRATKGSAGYDFYAPFSFTLKVGDTIKIPTGIRVILDNDKFLAIYPRSSFGFKYRVQLDNTVGIVDSDYSNSDNEGHIFIKITNDGKEGKEVTINKGEAFAQGIIQQYFTVEDDNVYGIRNGGFGSTNVKKN
jgi:dUTP pyrophosphatase